MEEFENLEIHGSIHEDPYNQKQIGDLSLYVDWESKTASIEEMDGNGIPSRVYHGLCQTYQLPRAVDIGYFKTSVYPRIIPLLEKMSGKYETIWNDINHVGKFNMDQEEQYQIESDILYECQAAPEIDGIVVFDMYDTCENYEIDIPEFFRDNGYDFMDIDFSHFDIEEIKEIIAGTESIWFCSDDEIRESLQELQGELKEEE